MQIVISRVSQKVMPPPVSVTIPAGYRLVRRGFNGEIFEGMGRVKEINK